MKSVKELLLKQTAEAFSGRPDMPLRAALEGVTQEEASWQPDASTPSIEQLIRHVAWSKSRFCQRGFGHEMALSDPSVNDEGDSKQLPWEFPCGAAWGWRLEPGIAGAIKLLEKSHRTLTSCLEDCSEEAMEQPIPAPHGKSAANFFWIMLMHDIYHAGTIRARRTLYKAMSNARRDRDPER